jgi:hypothetical protein
MDRYNYKCHFIILLTRAALYMVYSLMTSNALTEKNQTFALEEICGSSHSWIEQTCAPCSLFTSVILMIFGHFFFTRPYSWHSIRMPSSGMCHCVCLLCTDVLENHVTSIFRLE